MERLRLNVLFDLLQIKVCLGSIESLTCVVFHRVVWLAADEMEEGVTMQMLDYQKLVVHKICKCSWPASQIPDYLAALVDIAQ